MDEEIIHPTNRVWPGTPYAPMRSLTAAYEDGRATGKNWTAQWIPGGPWVGYGKHEGFEALYAHQRRVHDEWMKGWIDGFEESNPTLPDWCIRSHLSLIKERYHPTRP